MKLKLNLLTAAMVLAVSGASHASLIAGEAGSSGNSSAVFVALDTAGTISLTVDLGVSFASFLAASGTQGVPAGLTGAAGSLSAPGTSANWNFNNNTFNGVTGSNQWNTNVASFFSNANVTGGRFAWGVIASDAIAGPVSATNLIAGNNIMFTSGTAPDFDNSNGSGVNPAAIANASGAANNFLISSNGLGTQTAGVKGANTATAGNAFLGNVLAANNPTGDFGQQFGNNNFLIAPGGVSYLTWATQGGASGSALYAVGRTYGAGALTAANAATFAFDAATNTLTYSVPAVPEPGTYAMLLAGLVAVGAVANRRRFNR
jgi:PEP-CTERM motif